MVKWTEEQIGGGEIELEKDKSSQGKFDQFEINQQKFGLKTDYDENSYTTKLNKDEFTQEEIRRAEKIAKEIEGSDIVSEMRNNRHLLEERGKVSLKDNDNEEDLYSAVVRNPVSQVLFDNKETNPAPQVTTPSEKRTKLRAPKDKETKDAGQTIAASAFHHTTDTSTPQQLHQKNKTKDELKIEVKPKSE